MFYLFLAKWFAIFAHSSIRQKRRYTHEPYWHHPRQVVETLIEHGITDKEQLAAAWLHDTIEDVWWVSFTLLSILFPVKISCYVLELTNVTTLADGNRKARKTIEAIRLGLTCREAQNVKVADLINNSHSILLHDPKFAKVYLEEVKVLHSMLYRADRTLRDTLAGWIVYGEQVLKSNPTK